MGSGIQEAGLFRAERYEFEERTSDPTDTKAGESWLRTDITPESDQIATLRLDDGGGTVDIPVFDTAATTGSDVADIWRVRVGGITGFIPTVKQAGTYEQLRIQHNGTYRGAHDALTFSAIPDAVVSLYEYEDDSDTSTAIDSEGSNDATITGGSYTTTSNVGSLALSHDGSDDYTNSQNTVDLSAAGSTAGFALAGWQRWITVDGSGFEYGFGHYVDSNNFIYVMNREGNLGVFYKVNGNSYTTSAGPAISTGTWYHCYVEIQADGTIDFIVDDTSQVSESTGNDPSNLGAGTHSTGRYDPGTGNYANVIVDDFGPCDDPLTDSELQTMIDRSN